jgi:hypothetical protein
MLFEAVLSLEVVIYMVLFKLMHFIKLNMFQYSIFFHFTADWLLQGCQQDKKNTWNGWGDFVFSFILGDSMYSKTGNIHITEKT